MAGMGSALNFKGCTIQIDSYRRYRPAIHRTFCFALQDVNDTIGV